MLEPLQSEPFRTYALIAVGLVVGGSHGVIFLLSIVGLLLRPLWRQPIAVFYPWVRLTAENPDDIARTPLRPSRLLFIHMLWFTSSVGLWVGITLFGLVRILNELFPAVFGLDPFVMWGMKVPAWLGFSIEAMYTGAVASLSSWMWARSLRRSLAHYRRMNGIEHGGGVDDAGHYLAPFRKATVWAYATLPIFIGFAVLDIIMFPPFQG